MFKSLEKELRGRGEGQVADGVKSLYEIYGKDIPFPSGEFRVRPPFTGEEKEALKRAGLTAIYPFTGETIGDQREKGRKFRNITSADSNSVLTVRSLMGDVAVDPRPDKFFLPKSNYLTLDQVCEMVEEYSLKLQKKLHTDAIEAILGQAPDYSALAFAHFDATRGERLFGENYGYRYTWTETPVGGSNVVFVGDFNEDRGLHVRHWHRDDRFDRIWVAPLVVRKAEVGR